MTGAGPPTHPSQPPPDDLGPPPPDHAPASVGQLRTLRRWVAVAGVWAVAATVVALIALLDGGSSAPREDGDDRRTATDIGEIERKLAVRVKDIEEQVKDVASSGDLRRLEERLEEVEEGVSAAADEGAQAVDGVSGLANRIDELEGRIDELESEAESSAAGTAPPQARREAGAE